MALLCIICMRTRPAARALRCGRLATPPPRPLPPPRGARHVSVNQMIYTIQQVFLFGVSSGPLLGAITKTMERAMMMADSVLVVRY